MSGHRSGSRAARRATGRRRAGHGAWSVAVAALAGAASFAAVLAVGLTLIAGPGGAPAAAAAAPSTAATGGKPALVEVAPIAARPVSAAQLAALPRATTWTSISGVPLYPDAAMPDGTIVHPASDAAVYSAPGGPAVAVLPEAQPLSQVQDRSESSPTWVPVVASVPGWDEVLLPCRPQHSAGWIPAGSLHQADSPYRVLIDTEAYRLTVERAGTTLGTWTVNVGAADTPTPHGLTFLLAVEAPRAESYSPLLALLGTHSQALETYQTGPATTAMHGWYGQDPSGQGVSHGCVRVPPAALSVLTRLPLGTPVLIS